MSELAKTIERLELWAEYWEPHQVPELIADLRVLIGAARSISRAVHWLQKAQRYSLQLRGDYSGEGMAYCSSGDWIEIDDVVKAIQILQEGQQ